MRFEYEDYRPATLKELTKRFYEEREQRQIEERKLKELAKEKRYVTHPVTAVFRG